MTKRTSSILSALASAAIVAVAAYLVYTFLGRIDRLENNLESLELQYDGVKHIMEMQWRLSGQKINEGANMIDQSGKEVTPLYSLPDQESLILYFHYDQCQDCIAQEIAHLKEFQEIIPLLVVITFDSYASFKAYCQTWSHDFPVYYLPKTERLYERPEREFGVHAFICKNGKTFRPHIASASFPELSELYYKSLMEEYEATSF